MKNSVTREAPFPPLGVLNAVVANRWQQRATAELRNLHLSSTQFLLLAGIEQLLANGVVSQVDVARFTGCDVMLTSKHVRELADRGLIRRKLHPADSRAKALTLTKTGGALLKKALKVVERIDEEIFEDANNVDTAPKLLKALQTVSKWKS